MHALDILAARQPRLTGLAVLDDCSVAVSSQEHLATLRFAPRWARSEQPQQWPRAFRRAAATVLLINRFGDGRCRAEWKHRTALWALPEDAVHLIVAAMAGDRAEWLQESARQWHASDCAWASCYGLAEEDLLHEVVQKPLCQVLLPGQRACVLDPDMRPPLSFAD